jgi:hypothetical protein
MRSLAPPVAKPDRARRTGEVRVGESEEAWLGPVAIAVWLELGWMLEWPLTLTRGGRKAAANGWGRDALPIDVERRPGGAYWWEGRRASL